MHIIERTSETVKQCCSQSVWKILFLMTQIFYFRWNRFFISKLSYFVNFIEISVEISMEINQKTHILAQKHWFPTWKSRFSLSDSCVWPVITSWWEKVRSKTRYLGSLAPRAAFARAIFIVGKHSPNRSNLASKLAEIAFCDAARPTIRNHRPCHN